MRLATTRDTLRQQAARLWRPPSDKRLLLLPTPLVETLHVGPARCSATITGLLPRCTRASSCQTSMSNVPFWFVLSDIHVECSVLARAVRHPCRVFRSGSCCQTSMSSVPFWLELSDIHVECSVLAVSAPWQGVGRVGTSPAVLGAPSPCLVGGCQGGVPRGHTPCGSALTR